MLLWSNKVRVSFLSGYAGAPPVCRFYWSAVGAQLSAYDCSLLYFSPRCLDYCVTEDVDEVANCEELGMGR